MDKRKHIKTLLKEIEVYQSQDLYVEAMGKIKKLSELIQNLETDIFKFEKEKLEENDFNKETLFLPKEINSPALERAMISIMAGQFEIALGELNELIKIDRLRVVAAKNILRCHIGLYSLNDAAIQYQKWMTSGQFSPEELEEVGLFLQNIFEKKGIDSLLSQPKKTKDIEEDEFIDILSVAIPLSNEHQEVKDNKFDVDSQEENVISVTIPSIYSALIDPVQAGSILNNIQLY